MKPFQFIRNYSLSLLALFGANLWLSNSAQAAFENVEAKIQAEAIANTSDFAFKLPIIKHSISSSFTNQSENLISQLTPDSSNTIGDTLSPDRIQQLRQNLLISPPVFSQARAASPGSSLGSPTAYGASWGNMFAGVSYASQAQNENKADGSSVFGMGFGDPIQNLGFEVDVAVISLANTFADAGAVGFKAHKVFPELGNLGVAVGWSNAIKWGDAKSAKDTIYAVTTKKFNLSSQDEKGRPLTVSLGMGTGGFRSNESIRNGDNTPNVFASASLQVIPEMSLISNWTGNQLNMGISAAPFKELPVVFSVGASDITNNTDGGTRFLFNLGYSYRF